MVNLSNHLNAAPNCKLPTISSERKIKFNTYGLNNILMHSFRIGWSKSKYLKETCVNCGPDMSISIPGKYEIIKFLLSFRYSYHWSKLSFFQPTFPLKIKYSFKSPDMFISDFGLFFHMHRHLTSVFCLAQTGSDRLSSEIVSHISL